MIIFLLVLFDILDTYIHMRRRDEKFPDNGFEAWGGYMQAKISKLEEQFESSTGKEKPQSNIFNGVSIYVNGFTDPSADELKNLMSKHGGIYHTYQRANDYIIASNLPDTKVKNMSLAKVVRPEWITDSIASNILLDYRNYLLYKNSRTQKQLNFVKGKNDLEHVESSYNVTSSLYTENTDSFSKNSRTASNINDTSSSKVEPTHVVSHHCAKTATDPNFISEFYNNSRLHHISQLGACFKQYVNDLREISDNFQFPNRSSLKEKINASGFPSNDLSQITFEKGKTIMHIDMDCFFVSVGLRNKPELHGKPVAVTHSKGGQSRSKRPGVDRDIEFNLYRQKQAKKLGKAIGVPENEIEFESRVDNITDEDDKYGSMSEIASCSYEARDKGVGNGMFMGAALRLCPDLQTIPYDFEGYKNVAYTLYNTIAQYTLDIEAVSCDEMYVDCTDLLKDLNISVQDFATAIRSEIKSKTGCPCSTGFGGNRLQARLATKKAKPDGQFFLTEDLVADFMYDIKLRDLPGVGRQTSQKLDSLGHATCGSLQQMSLPTLKCHFGVKTGSQLFQQCRGRDPNPLTFHTVRKSVSAEVNYGIRFENINQCIEFLKKLAAEVHSRMLHSKVMGKCITLKLMVRAEEAPVETAKFMGHGYCNVINKSVSLNNPTNDIEVITKEVLTICNKLNTDPKEMRGVGIQITKLEPLLSRQITGVMSKFLSKKPANTEIKCDKKMVTESTETSENVLENRVTQKTAVEKKMESPRKLNRPSSSTIGQTRSPPGKRRGRQSKVIKLQQSTSKDVMSKFLTRDTPYKNPMMKCNDDLKPKIEKEQIIVQKQPKGLLGLPWKEVRELLRAWLDSGQMPLPCDINLISSYLEDMIINKNLEKLNILLNFLKRRTYEMHNNEWIDACNLVVEHVQSAMVAVYGKKLHLWSI